MPLVRVFHRTGISSSQSYLAAISYIQNIVAQCLTCDDPGGQLDALDVEIEVGDIKIENGLDDGYMFKIIIDANDYPSRKANLKERSDEIGRKIQVLPEFNANKTGYIWVRLFPATFVELGPKRKLPATCTVCGTLLADEGKTLKCQNCGKTIPK